MNLAWRRYPFDAQSGAARGYVASAWFLYHELRRVLGPELVDAIDTPAHPRVHLHYVPPHYFQPFPHRVNVLFSMWEGDALPDYVVDVLKSADLCLVPSEYCRAVWAAHGVEAEVVPLGVPDAYMATDPSRGVIFHPGRVLRFLAVGSALARKGWELLGAAWERAFNWGDGVQLYVKTVGDGTLTEHYGGGVVLDQRDVEPEELLRLYQSADVVVSASFGEGFGLPVLEGMATGCLAVAPRAGGMATFISPHTAVIVARSEVAEINYGARFRTKVASADDLAVALRATRQAWGLPLLEERRLAGCKLARQFTWQASILRLISVLAARFSAGPHELAPHPGVARRRGLLSGS